MKSKRKKQEPKITNEHLTYVINECYKACKAEVEYQCEHYHPDLCEEIEATAEFNSGIVIVRLSTLKPDRVEVIHDENEHNSDNIIYNVLHAMPELSDLVEELKELNSYPDDDWSEEQFRLDIMDHRPFVSNKYCELVY